MVVPADQEGRGEDNPLLRRGRPTAEPSGTSSRKAGGRTEESGPQSVSIHIVYTTVKTLKD